MTLTDLPTLAAPGIRVSLFDTTQISDVAAAADRYLVTPELEQLAKIGNAKRRQEWVAVRICAKLMLMRGGLIADPCDCQIAKLPSGRPFLVEADGRPMLRVGDCSLSHKGRFACVCLCHNSAIRVGVDIEEISPRLRALRGSFLSAYDALGHGDPADIDLAVLWTLKEAYSKAVGVGMRIGFRNLICDRDTQSQQLSVHMPAGARMEARHVVYKGYTVSVCFAVASLLPPVEGSRY